MVRCLIFFAHLLVLSSCNMQRQRDKKVSDLTPAEHIPANSPAYLFQNWEITDADHPMVKDVFSNNDSIYNFPGLVFLKDSNLVENPKGILRFGKFTLSEKKIRATFADGGTAAYLIKSLSPVEMQLQRSEKGAQTLLYLKADGKPFTEAKTNPFEPSLNSWRTRPKKPESKEEIKERVKQYVEFYSVFFDDHVQREATEINFQGYPCCFKWYHGGIYVQAEGKLDKKFISCFYSKPQAFEARQMLEDALAKKYTWDTSESNWIKQTAPVLKQIHDQL
ncbi:MAG: hypothetical protein ABJA57_10995 [Ginsengibacter sp.]